LTTCFDLKLVIGRRRPVSEPMLHRMTVRVWY
jgi:hypothetical protein